MGWSLMRGDRWAGQDTFPAKAGRQDSVATWTTLAMNAQLGDFGGGGN